MKEKLLIFGSGGLVGSSVSRLVTQKYSESFDIFSATRKDANLFSLDETRLLIEKEKPSCNRRSKYCYLHLQGKYLIRIT